MAQETPANGNAQLGSRLLMLLQQPFGLQASAQLMRTDQLAQMCSQLGLDVWFDAFRKMSLSMSQVSSLGLKKLVLSQAQSLERQLLKGEEVAASPKAMLHKLMDALNQPGRNAHADQKQLVQRSIDELEAAQVKAMQDYSRGELALRVVVPFLDADPVELYFRKPPKQDGQPDSALSVDIHSKSRILGEVWLQTIIRQSTQVELRMWALRAEVAQLAHDNALELGYELDASGLQLKSFEIFNAPRQIDDDAASPNPRGAVVDAKA
jgi:hypothetical protein